VINILQLHRVLREFSVCTVEFRIRVLDKWFRHHVISGNKNHVLFLGQLFETYSVEVSLVNYQSMETFKIRRNIFSNINLLLVVNELFHCFVLMNDDRECSYNGALLVVVEQQKILSVEAHVEQA